MKGAKYDMVVIDDPGGLFPNDARIPFQEFLIGLEEGCFAEGMKVSKRAVTSEFVVSTTAKGKLALIDVYCNMWTPRKAGRYHQLRRTEWHTKRMKGYE